MVGDEGGGQRGERGIKSASAFSEPACLPQLPSFTTVIQVSSDKESSDSQDLKENNEPVAASGSVVYQSH